MLDREWSRRYRQGIYKGSMKGALCTCGALNVKVRSAENDQMGAAGGGDVVVFSATLLRMIRDWG